MRLVTCRTSHIYPHVQASFPFLQMRLAKTLCPEYTIDQTNFFLISSFFEWILFKHEAKFLVTYLWLLWLHVLYSCTMLLSSWKGHHMTLNLVTNQGNESSNSLIHGFAYIQVIITHKNLCKTEYSRVLPAFLLLETCKKMEFKS